MQTRRGTVTLFTATAFLAAFLLFLIQPMVAKLVLPPYGGSSAVWNTTNAFFQATLLAGYAYSHVFTGRVRRRRQAPGHVALLLLPLLVLPFALPAWAEPPADRPPAAWLLLVLVVAIGGPFLAVSTSGPLLQRWFSYTSHPRATDPYFLYAASNIGSFVSLLAYPVLVEPRWAVASQARGWTAGYVALVVMIGACGFVVRGRVGGGERPAGHLAEQDTSRPLTPRPDRRQRARWLVLAAVPSSLMLGVTSFMTADLAAVPLLWVLPLSLYLATFVAAFGRTGDQRPQTASTVLGGLLAVGALVVVAEHDAPVVPAVLAHLALFTAGAYVAHRRLALDRPAAEHLTLFYLVVALGGVLGGAFNAFVAPLLFDRVLEYPLAILAIAVLGVPAGTSALRRRYGRVGLALEALVGFALVLGASRLTGGDASGAMVLVVALAAGVAVLVLARAVPAIAVGVAALVLVQVLAPLEHETLLESRTFFGVYRVEVVDGRVEFVSGSTTHGAQDPAHPGEPLSYYTRGGPVGQVMATYGPAAAEVGLVGLGAGAFAAYGEGGQRYTFYEIDPEVVRIARDSGWFTYLADTAAEVDYRVGDGRLRLAEPATPRFDVLVLDAFSGDSIPVHLLTVEAFDLYRQRLADGGVIAVHISNRYLDLRPVLAGAAEAGSLTAVVRRDPAGGEGDGSWWVAMAAEADTLAPLLGDDRWHPIDEAGVDAWTDERSNLLGVLGVEAP